MPSPFAPPNFDAMPPAGVPAGAVPPPNFGAPTAPPPMAPAPPAAVMPPRMPAFGQQPPPPSGWQGLAQMAAPIVGAFAGGRGDPQVVAAGLAGYVKGREMRRQQTENEQDRNFRRAKEQADFYSSIAKAALEYDDEAQLRKDLEAIRPLADVYGVNLDLFHVSDIKKQGKAQREAAAVFDQIVKTHKDDAYRPEWQKANSSQINGVTMTVYDIARMAKVPSVTDANGQAIAPSSPFKADNPNELKITAYARDHGKRPEQLTAAEIQEALGEGKAPTATVGSFEDFVVRKFGKNPTPAQITAARKEYQQSDDRPPSTGSGEYREFLMTDKLAKEWQTATQPVREMRRQFGLMQTGLQRFRGGDKNGGAQAVLVTFQKILDPTSVVRESEYARTAAGQAFMDRIQGYAERLSSGGAGLTDADMAAMVESAKQMLANAETFTQGTRQRIGRTAGRYKVPEELVFDDAGLPSSTAPDAGGGGSADSALAELERRRKARGVK